MREPSECVGVPVELVVPSALVVVAHPDDESFGLGAVLGSLVDAGVEVHAVCFTHGEASTLGDVVDLGGTREHELAAAAGVLGLASWELHGYPDGHLDETPSTELALHVIRAAVRHRAELLVVFDEGGITGHPDHERATDATLMAARHLDLAVVAWAIPQHVASALNAQFGTTFVGRTRSAIDLTVSVDRERQLRAIACHLSQAGDNPVLWRRLDLAGDTEPLRWLRRPPRRARRWTVGTFGTGPAVGGL